MITFPNSKKMKFNDEQFEALAPYEKYFDTAVHSSFASYPGDAALTLIHETYTAATRDRRRLNKSCSACIVALLRDCGRIWFRDRDERAAAAKAREVAVSPEPASTEKAVTVKTEKPAKSGRITAIKAKEGKTPAKPKRVQSREKEGVL